MRTLRNSCPETAFAAAAAAVTDSSPRITAASHSSVRWLMVSGSPTAGGLAGYLKKGTASIASQPPTAMVIANNGPDIPVSRRA